MTDIQEMTVISKRFSKDRNWGKYNDPKNMAMALCAEAAEVLEHFLWLNKSEVKNLSDDKKKKVAEELADVMHPLVLIADYYKIDILNSFKEKMNKNAKKYPIEKMKGKHSVHK